MSSQVTSVGRYEVLGELATGGMAEILLARIVGPGGFERPIVIKRILPHLARQRSFVDMFLEEARIASNIRHHNVIQVQELVADNAELFLVMEYLEGESLAGLTRRLFSRDAHMDRWLAAHVVAEACAGLHAAHEMIDASGRKQDLVHRDVSPQNVFVTYEGHIKILDFGIAKAGDGAGRTEAGQIRGKFAYMSPEQCRSERLDRRSDIFALGILLYELTTERRLFRAANPAETIRAICSDSVLPPSRLVEKYPSSLEKICMRALAFDREDRYATAADMRRDLVDAMAELMPRSARPDEALATLMRSLFEDRIAEKMEMLRRASSGAPITHVPAGEIDSEVEPPGVPLSERVEKRSGGRKLALTFALASVAGVGVLVGAYARAKPSPPAAATTADSSASAAAPLASAAASTSAQPDVLVHVETRPPGASVTIDGAARGTTPVDLRLARGAKTFALELRRAGYTPLQRTITAEADQSLLLDLAPSVSPRIVRTAPSSGSSASSSPWVRWN